MGELVPWAVLRGHDGAVRAVDCVEINDRVAAVSAGEDGTLRLWDLVTGEPNGQLFSGHDGGVTSVSCAVHDDRPVAVTGGEDGTLRLWDLAMKTPMADPIQHDEFMPVHRVVTARLDGRLVAVAAGPESMAYDGEGGYYSGGVVRVWDLATGSPVGEALAETDHTGAVACVEVAGRLVVVVTDYRVARGLFLPEGGPVGAAFARHDRMVDEAVTAELDGRAVIVTSSGYTVWRWDLESGEAIGDPLLDCLGSYHISVRALTCLTHADRPVVVTAGSVFADDTGFLRVFDLATRQQLGPEIRDRTSSICAIASAAVSDRVYAIVGGGDSVRVWDLTALLAAQSA
jgi:WD40 repeat protein